MTLIRIAIPVLALFAIGACRPAGPAGDREQDEQIIRELSREWTAALRAGDVDGLVAMYTSDAVIYEPGLQPITGTDALRTHFEELSALDVTVMEGETREVEVAASGDLAVEVGYTHWEWNDPEGPMTHRGPFIVVWRRENGTWRMAREIFNSDQPPALQ